MYENLRNYSLGLFSSSLHVLLCIRLHEESWTTFIPIPAARKRVHITGMRVNVTKVSGQCVEEVQEA
jgi:hypothetical protein